MKRAHTVKVRAAPRAIHTRRLWLGVNSHLMSLLSAPMLTPLGIYILLVRSLMSFSGRWIPSKMEPMIPGPSSTESGFPVRRTGSPTDTPAYHHIQENQSNSDWRVTIFIFWGRICKVVSVRPEWKGYKSPHRPGLLPCHPPNG